MTETSHHEEKADRLSSRIVFSGVVVNERRNAKIYIEFNMNRTSNTEPISDYYFQ